MRYDERLRIITFLSVFTFFLFGAHVHASHTQHMSQNDKMFEDSQKEQTVEEESSERDRQQSIGVGAQPEDLTSFYQDKAVALLKEGNIGKALTYVVASSILESRDPATSPEVTRCLETIRKRIEIEVGFAPPQNASFDPSLGPRLAEGVFRELWNRKIRAVSVFDEKRWKQRIAAHIVDASAPKKMSIEMTIFPVTVFTKECVRTEERKYEAGTIRTRNPEWDELARRKEILEARELGLKQEQRGYRDAVGQSAIAGLTGAGTNLVQFGTATQVGPQLAAISVAGGLASMLAHDDARGKAGGDLSSTRAELSKVRREIEEVEPMVEEPIYKEFVDNKQYFYKTARARCSVKLIDIAGPEEAVISARDIVEDIVTSDRYVHGNPLAGIRPDPKNLPSDGEMTDAALEKLIKATADDIEKSLGQIFLGYCGKAVAADKAKDKAQTIEESVNFLASCAVKTHPAYALTVAAYLDGLVAELIPGDDPAKEGWATKCFGIVSEKLVAEGKSVASEQLPFLAGVLIVFENKGMDGHSAILANEIAALLKQHTYDVLVKSIEQFERLEDFQKSRSENSVVFARSEKKRVAINVVASAVVIARLKIHRMDFCDVRVEAEVVAVDAVSGDVLLQHSARKTSRHIDETSAKRAATAKIIEEVMLGLSPALKDLISHK